jgi:hypothetical protein
MFYYVKASGFSSAKIAFVECRIPQNITQGYVKYEALAYVGTRQRKFCLMLDTRL